MAAKAPVKAKKHARHAPVKPPVYERRAVPLKLGHDLRVILHRDKRKMSTVNLDEFVEHLDWERSGSDRTGEMTVRIPRGPEGIGMIGPGDVVELWAAPSQSSAWRRVWALKVQHPPGMELSDGTAAVALSSAGKGPWDESEVAWKIKAGQRAHQVARDAARRFHLPLGRLAQGRHKLPKHIAKKASPEKIVDWAYGEERTHTGRRFDIDTSRGVLDVLEVKYPRFQAVLEDMIVSAGVAQSYKGFASAVVVISSAKVKGGKTKKVRTRVVNHARRRRYGYIVKEVTKDGLKSRAEARTFGQKWLARHAMPKRSITLTHPGYPWLDRGHAVTLPLADLVGFAIDGWVREVRHNLSGGSYEMEVTIGLSDPYVDARKARTRKKLEAAKRRRKNVGGALAPPPSKKRERHK